MAYGTPTPVKPFLDDHFLLENDIAAAFAAMTGNFNDGTIPGKIQWGSAWWFLDRKDGMEQQINKSHSSYESRYKNPFQLFLKKNYFLFGKTKSVCVPLRSLLKSRVYKSYLVP